MGLGGRRIWEMNMIFLVVLLLFGAPRLPEIGSSLGKGIREFKGSIKEIEKEVKAVGEPTKDAVPPVTLSPEQSDGGPRRLTTTPVSDAPPVHGGGVPTHPEASQEIPRHEEQQTDVPADDTEVSSDGSSEEEEAHPGEDVA